MSTGKRGAEGSPGADSTSTSNAADPPASNNGVKRVRLGDSNGNNAGHAASVSNALGSTADASDAAPSSPVASLVKNRNEQQQRSQRGGSSNSNARGGRGGKKNNNNNKGKQRDWSDSGNKGKSRNDEAKADDNDAANEDDDGKSKLPKKKVAMVIGYSGLGYNGSQINPGVRTIESEVFEACIKAGAISADNSDNVNKVSLMRAARTDAGVSAAINVLNLKLILDPPSKPEGVTLEAHINTFLPPAVRVWQIIRVQGGFHARTLCDSRMYNYSLPTYCFLEPREDTPMGKRIIRKEGEKSWWPERAARPVEVASEASTSTAAEASGSTAEPSSGPASTIFREDQALRKAYRIPPDVLDQVRKTLNGFTGSHNFWNFTVGKEFSDRSCQRNMKKLTVTDPFMVNDQEWVSLKFHGQSFMLHQIRKMVALVILCVRTRTPPSLIPETFGPARLNIPKAPALGLLLEQPQFESYNRKIEESNRIINKKLSKPPKSAKKGDNSDKASETAPPAESPIKEIDESSQLRDLIDYKAVGDQVEQFKRDVIFKTMHSEEAKEDTYALWLNLHDGQASSDFDYLNAKGVIPQSAIIGKNKPAKTEDSDDKAAKSATETGKQPAAGQSDATKTRRDSVDEDALLAQQNSGRGAADLEG